MATGGLRSLVDLCLSVIANDFETFGNFLNLTDNFPIKHLLQLLWTDVLFDRVEGPLRSRHATFFINPHLKTLDFNMFPLINTDGIIRALALQGQGVLSFCLIENGGLRYQEPMLLQLATSLPRGLKSLRLTATACSDKVLKFVGKTCTNLQRLELPACIKVTDQGIMNFLTELDQHENTTLRKLNLENTAVTARGVIAILDRCPNIVELVHHKLGAALFEYYHCRMLNNVTPLKQYDLKRVKIHSRFVNACLAICPNVITLHVVFLGTETDIHLCRNFHSLRHLIVHSLREVSISQFLKNCGTNLESITIDSGTVGGITVSVEMLIQFCPNITYLLLSHHEFENKDSVDVETIKASLGKLRSLNIARVNLTAQKRCIAALFARSPNVEVVTFNSAIGFSEEFADFVAIRGMPSVVDLVVYACDVNALALRKIINAAPNLKRLSIIHCKTISKAHCDQLRPLNVRLSLCYQALSD